MAEILKVSGLTRKNRFYTSVENVSFSLEEGQVLSLVGPEHSGKSLIVDMLTGVVLPDSGSIQWTEKDGRKPLVSVMYQLPSFGGNLSLEKTLRYKQMLLGKEDPEEIRNVLQMTGLSRVSMFRPRKFRGDELFRFSLAYALVGAPDVLILDEPLKMISPENRRSVLQVISDQSRLYHRSMIITGTSAREYQGFSNAVCDLSSGAVVSQSVTVTDETEVISKDALGYIEFTLSDVNAAKKVLDRMEIFSYQTKSVNVIHVLEQIHRRDEMVENFRASGIEVIRTQVVLDR